MTDNEIQSFRERVWSKIGPTLRRFAHFVAGFFVLYLVCGFFGDPTNFTRHSYWVQFLVLALPIAAYAYFGMFGREAPSAR